MKVGEKSNTDYQGRHILPSPYPLCYVCNEIVYYNKRQDPKGEDHCSHPYVMRGYRRRCVRCGNWIHYNCGIAYKQQFVCHKCWGATPSLYYVQKLVEELEMEPGDTGYDAHLMLFSAILYFGQDVEKIAEFTNCSVEDTQRRADNLVKAGLWKDGKFYLDSEGEDGSLADVVALALAAAVADGLIERAEE